MPDKATLVADQRKPIAAPTGKPKTEYDASGLPKFAFGQRMSLLTSPESLIGWDTGQADLTYAQGRIELRRSKISYPVIAKDQGIRAMRKKPLGGGNVAFILRHGDRGGYAAVYRNDGMVGIGKYVDNAWMELKTVKVPVEEPVFDASREFLEMKFTALGEKLTFTINGHDVVQVRDSTFTERMARIECQKSEGPFVEVGFLIPEEASLVADDRKGPELRPKAGPGGQRAQGGSLNHWQPKFLIPA